MNSSLYSIRGTRLYVEHYNDEHEDALLYLHGGPGASCVDFCYHQAQALSRSLRVIALDQRGVLRSDPIHEDEPFGLNDIIQDLEELRHQLGISHWSLLGHSFGGYLAVRYALEYPSSIKKIIFEAPCFDALSAARSIVTNAKGYLEQANNQDGVELCGKYLDGNFTANELWNALGEVFHIMDKDLLYFRGITPKEYNEIVDSQISSNDLWVKNQIHSHKLQEEGLFFENLMPRLSELTQPTLLLTGQYDPVCCDVQQQAYLSNIRNGNIVLFENSAHFPRLEEPAKYTEEVLKFIQGVSE
ncbi:alpha/beta hydrolase [Cohnella lubricantis]|uniref:Alpha/beta hydrolase n=1 Tax=Cohnella lubricantis TaxID=2163172 RepID=A0A841TF32_9BACL|nr:alpha/beta hydrolase [Cohnella lubricantis]MBB6677830.1 alpha/beta hydrolase [Cohnella lubricantis]MBP2120495.1 proline iminopeptidase [Cohnella lubricantis]